MYNIDIGTYMIENQYVTLTLICKFKPTKATFRIQLPDHYPNTTIGTNEKIKEHGLFYAKLELQTPPSLFWQNYTAKFKTLLN